MENQEERKTCNINLEELRISANPHKHILNQFEQVNHTAAGKRGLTAEQVATIICREKSQLLR